MADSAPDEGERGRYYAVRTGPQSMVIARAFPLCARCRDCGCGEQQEPIDLSPGGIMKLVSASGIKLPPPGEFIKAMRAGRNGS